MRNPDSEDLTALVEVIAAEVHAQRMRTYRDEGVHTRVSGAGEDLMVSYECLSEQAKDLNRGMVLTVLSALASMGYTVTEPRR